MGPLIDPEVLQYAEAHSTEPSAHLAAVDASTREEFPAWGMMVGRQEGRFLELLVFATQATSVLEIGTFTGYSSIAMAAGLPKDGSIISLEVDAHHATTARGNVAAAGLESVISVIEGPALDSVSAWASTHRNPSSMETVNWRNPIAGFPTRRPVLKSNFQACQGHATTPSSTVPNPSDAPLCGQRSSTAK